MVGVATKGKTQVSSPSLPETFLPTSAPSRAPPHVLETETRQGRIRREVDVREQSLIGRGSGWGNLHWQACHAGSVQTRGSGSLETPASADAPPLRKHLCPGLAPRPNFSAKPEEGWREGARRPDFRIRHPGFLPRVNKAQRTTTRLFPAPFPSTGDPGRGILSLQGGRGRTAPG